jgi:hypothetical protein
MVACFFNKPRILTTLIRAGADLVPRNNEGKDAYDVAVEKEFDECKEIVAKTLEKRGIKPGVKQNQTTSTTDKLTDDVEKLRIKR